ncbi:hypothetical protein GC170_12950 [bacterium]|nr:hypothetical protein [bacterium]
MIRIIEVTNAGTSKSFRHIRCGARRGAMAYVMLLSMFAFSVLGMFVMDIARMTSRKLEMQQVADSTAYSTSLVMTRGMNAVTVSNHHIGEVMAFVILHKAIAGENVDGRDKTRQQQALDNQLSFALMVLGPAALAAGGRASTFPDCAEDIRAAETVCDGKLMLKMEIASVYAAQIIAAAYGLQAVVAALSDFEEYVIKPEWDALDRMERQARADLPRRKRLEREFLVAIQEYQDEVLRDVPEVASSTAGAVAGASWGQGVCFPSRPELPLVREPFRDGGRNHQRTMARTQIVRAAYPWVVFDRGPVLANTSWMLLSQTTEWYRDWTDFDTTERSQWFYRGKGRPMLVIRRHVLPEKGTEPWTKDAKLADEQFSVIGFAYEPSPRPFGSPALKRQNKGGLVAYAQAITYGANPQNPGKSTGPFQPEIGWDTLAWTAPVKSSGAYEFPASFAAGRTCPRIHLNWQTKLVPVTGYLDRSVADTPDEVSRVVGRIVPVAGAMRTH